ncbi:MAG: hypothetical protein AVDCRST_MAG89-3675, partial [uncultured Gemmatimonadetes bacterium]
AQGRAARAANPNHRAGADQRGRRPQGTTVPGRVAARPAPEGSRARPRAQRRPGGHAHRFRAGGGRGRALLLRAL